MVPGPATSDPYSTGPGTPALVAGITSLNTTASAPRLTRTGAVPGTLFGTWASDRRHGGTAGEELAGSGGRLSVRASSDDSSESAAGELVHGRHIYSTGLGMRPLTATLVGWH